MAELDEQQVKKEEEEEEHFDVLTKTGQKTGTSKPRLLFFLSFLSLRFFACFP